MDSLTVTIKGEAKDALVSNEVPGIYILGPNSINGKSYWHQESDSNVNTIWYDKEDGWSGWCIGKIGSQYEIVDSFTTIVSFDRVASSPQEVSRWKYLNSTRVSYDILDGLLVQPGT